MSTPPTGEAPSLNEAPATASEPKPFEAAPVADAPAVKQTERPHPLTPFIRGWIVLVAIAVTWSRELVPDGRNDGFEVSDLAVALPVIGAVVLLAAGVGFLSWYFTRFVIDSDELRLETGAVF